MLDYTFTSDKIFFRKEKLQSSSVSAYLWL